MVGRQHPFTSPLGCGTAILAVAVIGVITFLFGGTLYSPGQLSAVQDRGTTLKGFKSHADFQNQCELCHTPLKGIEAARCETCHTTIAQQRTSRGGFHGKLKATDVSRCAACHPDHRGASFNPLDTTNFDHALVGFSLVKHARNFDNTLIECKSCHDTQNFSFVSTSCADCHAKKDKAFMVDHAAAFGAKCLACHDGLDKMKGFNHAKVKFVLDGKHKTVACAQCHKANVDPKSVATQCQACHAEPKSHAGMFGTDCAACHTSNGWTPAKVDGKSFDHAKTGFVLTSHQKNFDGSAFTCKSCHTGADFKFAQQTCVDCHGKQNASFMTTHIQKYGNDCKSCHDGSGTMKNFDHSKAAFVLDGKHATTECVKCHVNNKFKGTPKTCVSCHVDPKVHAGLFGTQCDSCHTTKAWTPAQLKNHRFPLNHGTRVDSTCKTCHTTTYTQYTCYGCHEHTQANIERKHREEGVNTADLPNCVKCHPTGREKG